MTLVLEWQAIRAILDAGAIRLGIEPPASTLPTRAETLLLLTEMPEPERLTRAVQFGASQLLGQHRGMWGPAEGPCGRARRAALTSRLYLIVGRWPGALLRLALASSSSRQSRPESVSRTI